MATESVTTQILLVEDDEDDYLLTLELLTQVPDFHFELDRVSAPAQALAVLGAQHPDVVLLDYRLGGSCGLDVLRAARSGGYDGPVIMLTGQCDRETDLAAMRAGATDYLVKSELTPALIERSVRYALERQHLARELALTGRRLRQSEAQLRTVMEHSIVGLMLTDAQGTVLFANPRAAAFLARPVDSMIGAVSPLAMRPGQRDIDITAPDARHGTGELSVQPISWRGRPALLATIVDVTARKRAEAELVRQAGSDALTGLANRALFQEHLSRALRQADRAGNAVALLFVDLDRFKQVNDHFGHDAGDALIRAVATRISECMRADDLVARLGGDEFAVIMRLEHVDDAGRVADKILRALQSPLQIGSQEIAARASIGIATYPSDAGAADALVKAADTAMYEAKRLGRNNYQYFSAHLQEAAVIRSILEYDLNHALRDDLFELHFQPQLAADALEVVGAEALLRWHHERRGLLTPREFIDVAEDSGLIVPIGQWIVQRACRQMRTWRKRGLQGRFSLAVNVSVRQFLRDDIAALVLAAIDHTGIDAHDIEIELTESTLIEDFDNVLRSLSVLHNAGVRIAIDDFGTGYSSLQRLSRLPIDYLKIDRSFVEDIGRSHQHEIIVKSTIDLAHNLGVKVIAEGVETEQQAAYLRANRCDLMQGYLFSRPLPETRFEQLLPHRRRIGIGG